MLVMYAGIQASLEERRAEHGVLRTLGARRSQLLGSLVVLNGTRCVPYDSSNSVKFPSRKPNPLCALCMPVNAGHGYPRPGRLF